MAKGKVVQVFGQVVDIRFPTGELPQIFNALAIKKSGATGEKENNLMVEVTQHLGDDIVRAIVLGSPEGLARGMEAEDTGKPITVPVGPECLGRLINILV
jgi:F-type H+-transporting ATPase subunit beta